MGKVLSIAISWVLSFGSFMHCVMDIHHNYVPNKHKLDMSSHSHVYKFG